MMRFRPLHFRNICFQKWRAAAPGEVLQCEMRVLVVEDDQAIADAVSCGLIRAGYRIDGVEDGESGYELGHQKSYDAAVIDLMLTGIDVLNLIERLRADQLKMPLSVLSAKRSTDDKVMCLRRGADDYLAKPCDLSELL